MEVRLPRLGRRAELLADSEFQEVEDAKLAKGKENTSGIVPEAFVAR
jgi:hypothetical protein